MHESWRTWRKPLRGNRIRLRHSNPAGSGAHTRQGCICAAAARPITGRWPALIARFDGGQLSSDGGLLALREVKRRLGLAERLAVCLDDPRAPRRVQHDLAAILRFRLLMIAAGYENGNDADSLRHDPLLKLVLGRLPNGAALCSQPTIPRLEN